MKQMPTAQKTPAAHFSRQSDAHRAIYETVSVERIISLVAAHAGKSPDTVRIASTMLGARWCHIAMYLAVTYAAIGGRRLTLGEVSQSFVRADAKFVGFVARVVVEKLERGDDQYIADVRALEEQIKKGALNRQHESKPLVEELLIDSRRLTPFEILAFVARYYEMDPALMTAVKETEPNEQTRARRIGYYMLAKVKAALTPGLVPTRLAEEVGIDIDQLLMSRKHVETLRDRMMPVDEELRRLAKSMGAFARLSDIQRRQFIDPRVTVQSGTMVVRRPAKPEAVELVVRPQKIDYAAMLVADVAQQPGARKDVADALVARGFITVAEVARDKSLARLMYAPKTIAEYLGGKAVPGCDKSIGKGLAGIDLPPVAPVIPPPTVVKPLSAPKEPPPLPVEDAAGAGDRPKEPVFTEEDVAVGMQAFMATADEVGGSSLRLDSHPFARNYLQPLLDALQTRGIVDVAAMQIASERSGQQKFAAQVSKFFDGSLSVVILVHGTNAPSPLAMHVAKIAQIQPNEAYAAWRKTEGGWRVNPVSSAPTDQAPPKKANGAAPVKEVQEEETPDPALCAGFAALLREKSIWGGTRSQDAEMFVGSVSSALRNKRSSLSPNKSIFIGLYQGTISPVAGGKVRAEAKFLIERLVMNKDGELTRLMPAYFPARPHDTVDASPTGGAPMP